jgi:crossover junction endodeoxyribonuclease RusA
LATRTTVTLPYPPTVNTYWRYTPVGRSCRVFLSAKGRDYKKQIAGLLYGLKPSHGRIQMEVEVNPPDRRKRDLDNILKALLDSMQGILYMDDEQIDCLIISRRGVVPSGKITISVETK